MTFGSLSQSSRPGRRQPRLNARLESPAQLAVIGLVVWLIGAFIHPFAILVPLGLILLLVAGVAYLVRPQVHTMYWRGRQIELDDERSAVALIYRLFFRR